MVPLGLLVLGMYHVWLLYTIIRYPSRTVIGLNANSRYQWVLSIMAVSILSLHLSILPCTVFVLASCRLTVLNICLISNFLLFDWKLMNDIYE